MQIYDVYFNNEIVNCNKIKYIDLVSLINIGKMATISYEHNAVFVIIYK